MPCGQHSDERVKTEWHYTHLRRVHIAGWRCPPGEKNPNIEMERTRVGRREMRNRARPLRTSQCRCQTDFARMSARHARERASRMRESGSRFDSVTRMTGV